MLMLAENGSWLLAFSFWLLALLPLPPSRPLRLHLGLHLLGMYLRLMKLIRAECSYGTGHGFTFHISAAYSRMVRSLENFPELAMFSTALRVQSPGSA